MADLGTSTESSAPRGRPLGSRKRLSTTGVTLISLNQLPLNVAANQGAGSQGPSSLLLMPNTDSLHSNVNPESIPLTGYSGLWLGPSSEPHEDIILTLLEGLPSEVVEYSEHLFKVSSILYDGKVSIVDKKKLEAKLAELTVMLPRMVLIELKDDPSKSKLYLIVERCFDVFIKIITNLDMVNVATIAVRFLTTVMMTLNYWEIYNLLRWRPAIYQFLILIKFDFSDCYTRFLRDYEYFRNTGRPLTDVEIELATEERLAKERFIARQFRGPNSPEAEEILGYSFDPDLFDEHDKFVLEQLSLNNPVPKKRLMVDHKLAAHRVIKRPDPREAIVRNSNYDPDVVHECHLPSADEPGMLCLRRFSRKYELIRHQETVHSKRKKLFKCYVCVKQNPAMGPRIFTRHDTLAKHIRVNHRISGKEAKAEVAYSKKHAEIVDESKINISVGRRKVKGEYEFLVVLDRRQLPKKFTDDGDGDGEDEEGGSPENENASGEEVEIDVI